MIDLKFTEADKEALCYERFHHPHPRVQLKMEALWLKSQDLPHWQICQLTGITENTLRAYFRAYASGGVEGLKEIHFYQPQSELESYRTTLEAHFRQHPPATIAMAIAEIESITGIRRSPTQVRTFLKSMGMRCLKVGSLPAKADPDAQAEFQEHPLLPRLEAAKAGERAVFLSMLPILSWGLFWV